MVYRLLSKKIQQNLKMISKLLNRSTSVLLNFLLSILIKFYQKYISHHLPCRCKYQPTCSEYMLQAIQVYGVFKGIVLGIKRLCRCTPCYQGGFDPIPKKD